MPALQQEYDYYEYARRRQGTVKTAVPNSAVRKNTSNKVSATKVNPKTLKTTTTRDITRNSTRIATRDDNFIGTKRKATSSKVATKAKTTSKKASK